MLFHDSPCKVDLLRTLLPSDSPCIPCPGSRAWQSPGDVAGSLVRLAERIGLTGHHWQVLSAILFREACTHPDVRDHLSSLYAALMELTESFLDAASARKLDRGTRDAAAGTCVAVLLHQAYSQRFNGPTPDLGATAEIVFGALFAQPG